MSPWDHVPGGGSLLLLLTPSPGVLPEILPYLDDLETRIRRIGRRQEANSNSGEEVGLGGRRQEAGGRREIKLGSSSIRQDDWRSYLPPLAVFSGGAAHVHVVTLAHVLDVLGKGGEFGHSSVGHVVVGSALVTGGGGDLWWW